MSSRKAVLVPASGSSASASSGVKVYVFGDSGSPIVETGCTPKITVELPGQLLHWRITANVAPTGQSLIYDVKKNGSSIFPSGNANKIVLPAGSLEAQGTAFASSPYNTVLGDKLLSDCLQIGSGNPGTKIQIQITSQLT